MITSAGSKVLLDCGLFQGLKALRMRNWEAPAFDPGEIDAVVLSHAHLDHSGYLPLLARLGFYGPVYCTPATSDLLGILLRDSAYLQEEQAAHANKFRYSRHEPALPLYTMEDVEATLPLLQARSYDRPFEVTDGIEATFRCAGHILGSATVGVHLDGKAGTRIVFTGDLGRWGRPILKDPAPVREADVLLVNPTHVAVALRYAAGETDAPEVVAKGRALLAERIRKIATEHRIPIVSDPPLARALYRSVPVGAQIPAALFRAVAEVLAMVVTRKSRKARPSGPAE